MAFVDRMDQNLVKCRIGIQIKKWWWSPLFWMVYVVIQKFLESLRLLHFRRNVDNAIFLKYLKESRSSSSRVSNRNVPQDFCYDDTKHYQVPFEKQGRWKVCKKISRHCWVECKVDLYIFWNISWILLANVWLRNVSFKNVWISKFVLFFLSVFS